MVTEVPGLDFVLGIGRILSETEAGGRGFFEGAADNRQGWQPGGLPRR